MIDYTCYRIKLTKINNQFLIGNKSIGTSYYTITIMIELGK